MKQRLEGFDKLFKHILNESPFIGRNIPSNNEVVKDAKYTLDRINFEIAKMNDYVVKNKNSKAMGELVDELKEEYPLNYEFSVSVSPEDKFNKSIKVVYTGDDVSKEIVKYLPDMRMMKKPAPPRPKRPN